jgi:hypothetical protein
MMVFGALASLHGPRSLGQVSPSPTGPYDPAPNPQPIDFSQGQIIIDDMPPTPRRTDGGDPISPIGSETVPELLSIAIGRWAPTSAAGDPLSPGASLPVDEYQGAWSDTGEFLRVDLVFQGRVNPPGPVGHNYDPHRFGPSPLYAFIEFDIDRNANTGGERDEPEFRYNANVARFGGMPQGVPYVNRIAFDGGPYDTDPLTPPHIDRSGEDFHLSIFGEPGDIVEIRDVVTGDLLCSGGCVPGTFVPTFAAGDVWDVAGPSFGLAHGFSEFNVSIGSYDRHERLRFAHDEVRGVTLVSLIYPLTQRGWAIRSGTSTVPAMDYDTDADYSMAEAVFILQQSATFGLNAADPYWMVIADWACNNDAEPVRCANVRNGRLNPANWRVTALVGTMLAIAPATTAGLFVPTNIVPGVVVGDFNGDGWVTQTDAQMLADFIDLYDQDPAVDAGAVFGASAFDGIIQIINFGPNFSIYDVNYDGQVDAVDLAAVEQDGGDYDNDNDFDLRDVAAFQACFTGSAFIIADSTGLVCRDAFDLDGDLDIDLNDLATLTELGLDMTGPLP